MKTHLAQPPPPKARPLRLLEFCFLLSASCFAVHAQSTAFTYQGQLADQGQPASGRYDFRCALFADDAEVLPRSDYVTNAAVVVSNGLFLLTLDFGASPLAATLPRWLEIGVRTNGSPGNFTVLQPRQKLTSAPYAIFAKYANEATVAWRAQAADSNAVNNASLQAGSVTTDKIADGAITVADLNPVVTSNTFWRLDGNSGTTSGTQFLGTTDNQPLELRVNNQRALRLEPNTNGTANLIAGSSANVIGPSAVGTTIAGGGSTALGLRGHLAEASYGTIGGGLGHVIGPQAESATISGGFFNEIGGLGFRSAIAGGFNNRVESSDASIGGGSQNTIGPGAYNAVVAGGSWNRIQNSAQSATISGGLENTNAAWFGVIGGGTGNSVASQATYATIGGGAFNTIQAEGAGIGGGRFNMIQTDAHRSTIGGGLVNTIQVGAYEATISGGRQNTIGTNAPYASIGGGDFNTIQTNAASASIGGGELNTIQTYAYRSTIGGGLVNTIQAGAAQATIAGGYWNDIGTDSDFSAIGGGDSNKVLDSAPFGTIPGGRLNSVAGAYAFAAGRRAKANHTGSFVWADATDADFASTVANQFSLRASGGVRLETAGAGLRVDGQQVFAGTLPASSVGTSNIADHAVTSAKILDGSLTAADLAPNTFVRIAGDVMAGALSNTVSVTSRRFFNSGNAVTGSEAIALGGYGNTPRAAYGTIAGGESNDIGTNSYHSTIGGGRDNTIAANAWYATIAGGQVNDIATNSPFSVIGGGGANIIAGQSDDATIAGGKLNRVGQASDGSAIGGGYNNKIGAYSGFCTIAGGYFNEIGTNSGFSSIGGGGENTIADNAWDAMIPGGWNNRAGALAFAAGHRAKADHTGTFVWADSQNADFASTSSNQFLIRASGGVGIGTGNPAASLDIDVPTPDVSIRLRSGGISWPVTLNQNAASSLFTLDNGYSRFAMRPDRKAGFGTTNPAADLHVASDAGAATLVIGQHHQSGGYTALYMGPSAVSNGYAYVQGIKAAGSSYGDLVLNPNAGNVGIGATNPTNKLQVAGNIYATGTITPNSDRNVKTDFAAVDTAAVLGAVTRLPIQQWRFKAEPEGIKHLGPMAQDFRAAFGLGEIPTAIATVDADGVALAAIQGLNQKLETAVKEKDTRIAELERKNHSLESRLTALEEAIQSVREHITPHSP